MDECERSWTVRKLLRHAEPAALARRAGDRLLHLVAGLEGGYAGLRLRSGSDGTVEIHFLSRGASEEDVTEPGVAAPRRPGRAGPATHPARR